MIFSVLSSLVLIEPFVIFRNFFAGIFSADQIVIQNTCPRILCILFFEPLCNLYEIPAGVLRGTEHSLYPAVATISGTCCFRIAMHGFQTLPSVKHSVLCISDLMGVDDTPYCDRIYCKKAR